MNVRILSRAKHIRDDGWLSELVSMNYTDEPFTGVHSYLVSITPGHTRANHYHEKKEEWLAPASGTIELLTEDIHSHVKEQYILDTKTKEYSLIYIPPFIAHTLKNSGAGDASVVVFSRTPEDLSDTIRYEVTP